MKFLSLCVALLVANQIDYCSCGVFYIGASFDRNKKLNSVILDFAVRTANEIVLSESDVKLGFLTEKLEIADEFGAAESVCRLLDGKNFAILGPKSPTASAHVVSICDAKEIPYIDTYMDVEAKTSTINLYPSHATLSDLLIEVVNRYEWQDFTILYEAPNFVKRVALLLEDRNNKPGIVTLQPVEVGTNFRKVLQKIKDMGGSSTNIIIDCSIERLFEIMEQALQVGLFTPDRSFIITNLDAQTIDLERYQYTQANITLFRILNPEVQQEKFKDIDNLLDEEKDKCENFAPCTEEEIEELNTVIMQTSTALIYDATMGLAEALKQIGFEHLQTDIDQGISCFDTKSTWSKGLTITNYMKNCNYTGLTGIIEFDTQGFRSNVEIDVVTLNDKGLIKTGIFKPSNMEKLTFLPIQEDEIDTDDLPISAMTFNVIIALVEPYIMLKDSTVGLIGNDRFEGFGIDIIDDLSRLYGFKYNFILYGSNYGSWDNATNSWTGMIGEVVNGNADLAIADLTINSNRILALDFTPSFMNLGIALLYRKPTKEPPSTFSFMLPFSKSVWTYLGIAYIGVSLCFFCLGRMSPSQWENKYPCIEEPTFLENQFTLNNSMWFAAGALLQQGSEIEPKAASIRVASSFWWFFTLIMVSSYTANLAMFLVIENKTSKIDSVEDLADCGVEGMECPIRFGAKKGGATFGFFKESSVPLYQNMYNYMMSDETLMTASNEEGIERVYSGVEDYAFLMESKSIEYYTERLCNLTQVGDPLDDKNYGIGMRKNFVFNSQLSEGVLQLQEKGVLASLYKKWWKERKGGGACSDAADDGAAVPLEMANVVGVFYVLIIGTVFAILYGTLTFLWALRNEAKELKKGGASDAEELKFENLKGVFLVLLYGSIFASIYGCSEACFYIYKKAKSEKISFKEELIAELQFLISCQDVKQVRHRKGSKSSKDSGASYRGSNQSRYSGNGSQAHGSNMLLNLNE